MESLVSTAPGPVSATSVARPANPPWNCDVAVVSFAPLLSASPLLVATNADDAPELYPRDPLGHGEWER